MAAQCTKQTFVWRGCQFGAQDLEKKACNAITFANMTLSQAPRFERTVLARLWSMPAAQIEQP
jgi:hypothetical protein